MPIEIKTLLNKKKLFRIKRNRDSIDDKQLKLLWKQSNFKLEENDLIIGEG